MTIVACDSWEQARSAYSAFVIFLWSDYHDHVCWLRDYCLSADTWYDRYIFTDQWIAERIQSENDEILSVDDFFDIVEYSWEVYELYGSC